VYIGFEPHINPDDNVVSTAAQTQLIVLYLAAFVFFVSDEIGSKEAIYRGDGLGIFLILVFSMSFLFAVYFVLLETFGQRDISRGLARLSSVTKPLPFAMSIFGRFDTHESTDASTDDSATGHYSANLNTATVLDGDAPYLERKASATLDGDEPHSERKSSEEAPVNVSTITSAPSATDKRTIEEEDASPSIGVAVLGGKGEAAKIQRDPSAFDLEDGREKDSITSGIVITLDSRGGEDLKVYPVETPSPDSDDADD